MVRAAALVSGDGAKLQAILADNAALAEELAAAFDAAWVCAGRLSKAGHPHHPLYLRKDEAFRPFDIGGYLR